MFFFLFRGSEASTGEATLLKYVGISKGGNMVQRGQNFPSPLNITVNFVFVLSGLCCVGCM